MKTLRKIAQLFYKIRTFQQPVEDAYDRKMYIMQITEIFGVTIKTTYKEV